MNRDLLLKGEIKNNLIEIYNRMIIVKKLMSRLLFKTGMRTPELSYSEYDHYWDTFWDERDTFNENAVFTYYDKPLPARVPPFYLKQNCALQCLYRNYIVKKIIEDKIAQYKFKTVLEVGSGAGLNLMMLAPLFPNVEFFGLEPTESGVRISTNFINNPPPEFEEANWLGSLKNIRILRGSILDKKSLQTLDGLGIDFVFTAAVLEQLHSHLDLAFENIFNLSSGFFLFCEEWLEANYLISNYQTLVESDYFRVSWNYLNNFTEIETLERSIPPLQPSWLKYGVVFCKKSGIPSGEMRTG